MKKHLILVLSFLALAAFSVRADTTSSTPAATAPAPMVGGPSVNQTGDAPVGKDKEEKAAKKKKKKKHGKKGADASATTPATAPDAGAAAAPTK